MTVRARLLIQTLNNGAKFVEIERLAILFTLHDHFLDAHQIVNPLHEELVTSLALVDLASGL